MYLHINTKGANLAMQTKIRVVIAHKQYPGAYINRGSNGLTTDLDGAITFRDEADASEWLLNAWCAPVEKEAYKYTRIKVTKEVLEDENDERSATKELVPEN